ncbi:MAG TPA: nucleotidyltransferase domain-containing protein [Ilumatobacteraceae bacterium]|nr:nucleotidyltransferase domain-containing protein [Ilumatobacteraceae bacterium]
MTWRRRLASIEVFAQHRCNRAALGCRSPSRVLHGHPATIHGSFTGCPSHDPPAVDSAFGEAPRLCDAASTWTVEDGKAVWTGRRLAEWLPDLTADIAGAFDPIEIWVYGSVARGDDDGDSDSDVLLVLDRYDPSAAIEQKVKAFRCSSTAAPLDVSFTDPERFETRKGIPVTIERAAVLDGGCLFRRV